jgi:hypothetical protein
MFETVQSDVYNRIHYFMWEMCEGDKGIKGEKSMYVVINEMKVKIWNTLSFITSQWVFSISVEIGVWKHVFVTE